MAWTNVVLTEQGGEMVNELLGGGSMQMTRAAGGDGLADSAEISALTAMDEKQELELSTIKSEESGKRIQVLAKSLGLESGYQLRQIGIWAKLASDTEEQLFLVAQDESGIPMPSEEEMPNFAVRVRLWLSVSNDADITLAVEAEGAISEEEITSIAELALDEHNADQDAHTAAIQKALDGLDIGCFVIAESAPENTEKLWIDLSADGLLKYYDTDSKAWLPTSADQNGGFVRQDTAPEDTGLLWIDSANSDTLKFYNGTAWVAVTTTTGDLVTYDLATQTAAGLMSAEDKTKMDEGFIVLAESAPKRTDVLWVDTSAGNTAKYYDSTASKWEAIAAAWG